MKFLNCRKVKAGKLKEGDWMLLSDDVVAVFMACVSRVAQPKEPLAEGAKPTMKNRMTITITTGGRLRPLPTDVVFLEVQEKAPKPKRQYRRRAVSKGNGAVEALSA